MNRSLKKVLKTTTRLTAYHANATAGLANWSQMECDCRVEAWFCKNSEKADVRKPISIWAEKEKEGVEETELKPATALRDHGCEMGEGRVYSAFRTIESPN